MKTSDTVVKMFNITVNSCTNKLHYKCYNYNIATANHSYNTTLTKKILI